MSNGDDAVDARRGLEGPWLSKKLDQVEKILERPCPVGGGTRVTNCVIHLALPLTSRPTDCQLCATDVANHLNLAIKINEFLNSLKDESLRVIRA